MERSKNKILPLGVALFVVLGLLLFFILPAPTQAALVPCGGAGQPDCTLCHIFALINNVFKLVLTGIIPSLAVIGIAWGAMVYFTSGGSQDKLTKGRKIIVNTVVGLTIAYASFLIVQTVLGVLSEGEGGNFKFQGGSIVISCTGGGISDVGAGAGDANSEENLAIIERLEAAGITVKEGVVLTGTRAQTLNEIIALANSCGCEVIITSGIEGDHASGTYSHENGYKVDLRKTGSLDSYIRNNFTRDGLRNGDQIYISPSGQAYVDEGDHWDVTVR